MFGAIIFTVLASGEVQSWAKTTKRTPLSTTNRTVGINDDVEPVIQNNNSIIPGNPLK